MFEIIINSANVPKIYVEGNRGPHREDEKPDEWSLVSYKWDQKIRSAHYGAPMRYETWPITTTSADEAFPITMAFPKNGRTPADSTRKTRPTAMLRRIRTAIRTSKGFFAL